MKGGDDELREKAGVAWIGCEGECLGELLAREERSDEALWMETRSLSVNRPGQNSMSSSRSKERPASNLERKTARFIESAMSRTLLC